MTRLIGRALTASALAVFCLAAQASGEGIAFTAADRLLVVAPHPDDETIGTGGIIQSALAAGAGVNVVYLTRGESNEISSLFYQKKPMILTTDFIKIGRLRKNEAIEAMKLLGVPEKDLIFLGYPDLGTLAIWEKVWEGKKPYRSFFSRVNKVIHHDDLSYGKYFRGTNVIHDFEKVLLEHRPTHVFVTAPFDSNPDHQAAYLFLNAALMNLRLEKPPAVHLYLVHTHDWPKSHKPGASGLLEPPQHFVTPEVRWSRHDLTPAEIEKKRRALAVYESQTSYAKNFLYSFVRTNEIYAEYPYGTIEAQAGLTPDGWAAGAGAVRAGDVRYAASGTDLFIEIPLVNAIDEMGALTTSVFGYKDGAPFSQMPKLSLRLFGAKLRPRDFASGHFAGSAFFKIDKNRLLIRIPLTALKEPDYLFVTTRTSKTKQSLDFGGWRVLRLARSTDSGQPPVPGGIIKP